MHTPTRSSNKPGTQSECVATHPSSSGGGGESPASSPVADFLKREGESNKLQIDHSVEFRHGHWAPFRSRVEQALRDAKNVSPRRVSAFCACGCDAWVAGRIINFQLPSIKEYKILSTKCHDRFCLPCSQEKSYRMRQVLLAYMKPLDNLKLLTLTLKASDDHLSKILDRITRHFRALRSTPLWKKNVTGGVATIETVIGENSGKWHVHFHVLMQSKYIPQKLLREAWKRITGDSTIVDIRPVGARIGAVTYITKYITKAADHGVLMNPKLLIEAIEAFTGRRLVSTFGNWRGLKLMEKPNEREYPLQDGVPIGETTFTPMRPLTAYITAAAAGDRAAALVLWKLNGSRGRPPPGVGHIKCVVSADTGLHD